MPLRADEAGPFARRGCAARAGVAIISRFPFRQASKTMTESVLDYMTRLGRAARDASRVLARASTAQKN
ncbi:hypothetical protein NAV31_15530, partial [Pseudomonas stutzeri]|nr:hypothetical protein [Stutzerimonas degradans]